MKRIALATLVAATAAACDGRGLTDPGPQQPAVRVQLTSDPGDWVGGGGTYEYSQKDAVIEVEAVARHLAISIRGDESWDGRFQLPGTLGVLMPGTYDGLIRYPFNDPPAGGLAWTGEGRGCNTITGSLTIESATYVDNILRSIALHFEQHCEGGGPALRGVVQWRHDDPTVPPGPVLPVPATLWRPPQGAIPSNGHYVYLESQAGDYIGQGGTYFYGAAAMAVTASGGDLEVVIGGEDWWYGNFRTMVPLNRLEPGYYGGLRRYPFHNPVKGGLAWIGMGRGCNRLTGWFAIDHVAYSGDRLTSISLRFEQHCEGHEPALRGAIRWTL